MGKILIKNFNLRETLYSAQFFYFKEFEKYFYIIDGKDIFKVWQENDFLFFEGTEERKIKTFFSLDFDFENFKNSVKDENIYKAILKHEGLRLIKSSPEQTIVSFICSSAANFSKIRMNVELISEFFGDKISFDGKEFYLFPELDKLTNLELLKKAKTGFRAKFLYKIGIEHSPKVEKIIRDSKDYLETKKELMTLPGIGSKVADCILLFGFGYKNSFPVDTWIKRGIENLYFDGKNMPVKKIEEFVCEKFKICPGLEQQYLFHYLRNENKSENKENKKGKTKTSN